MSATNPLSSGQRAVSPSISLNLALGSNNPFRNRAASPSNLAVESPASPFDDPPPPASRPISRNPFLDQPSSSLPDRSSGVPLTKTDSTPQTADDFFQSLSLEENKQLDDKTGRQAPLRRPIDPAKATERRPSGPIGTGAGESKHQPTRSQEEALKARKAQGRRAGPSASPQRKPQRSAPRRNSDSSVMDFDASSLTAEERKIIEAHRARDRQRREREAREKASEQSKSSDKDLKENRDTKERREPSENRPSRDKDGKERSKSGKPSRRMDIIDQLDATSIYGTGLFHHDGPFDALNPHRNKSSRRAPMQAFPKDSLNNALGGFGPVNSQANHATFMGNGNDEAFRDYARGGKSRRVETIFDTTGKTEMVHGDESYGLGTSTFLEGTPAARSAIVKSQQEQAQAESAGLQRKKSLAQRIRQINRGPRDFNASGRQGGGSPGEVLDSRRSPPPPPPGTTDDSPFFSEYGKGEDVISVQASAQPREGALSPSSPPPLPRPRRGSHVALERRATTDATSASEDSTAKPSGLLGRMKSLKGGKRRAPEVPANPSPGSAL